MTITALPAPPSNTDSPAVFATKAGAFVAALPRLRDEINAEVTATIPAIVSTVSGAAAKALIDIPAAVGQVDEAVAATYVGHAAAQAALAAAARTASEAARDIATQFAGIYPTTALGVTATNALTNKYFSTPSSDDAENLILWLNTAGVAVEQKRYLSPSGISNKIDTHTSEIQANMIRVIGTASPAAGTIGGAGTYLLTGCSALKGLIQEINIYSAAQAVKLKVFRAVASGGSDLALAYEVPLMLTAGFNKFSFSEGTLTKYLIAEGDVLGLYFPTGVHYILAEGSTGYSYFAGDQTANITHNGTGANGGVDLQFNVKVSSTSSALAPYFDSERTVFGREFSVGEKTPAVPLSVQYMSSDTLYAFDYEFRNAAVLKRLALCAAVAGTGKIVVLAPYLGGYKTLRSVQVRHAAGAVTLAAGVDFASDIYVPKGGLIAYKAGAANTIYSNPFDALQRYRYWYGDAADGIYPSFNWPAATPHLSDAGFLTINHQLRIDFETQQDAALVGYAPQYMVQDKFDQTYGPVSLRGDAWVKGAGKMTSTSTAIADRLEYAGGNTHLSKFTARFKFRFTAAGSAVYFFKRPHDGAQGCLFSLDMTGNAITQHNGFESTGTLTSVYSARASTLTFAQGKAYIVTLDKNYKTITLTITDAETGASDALVYDGFTVGAVAGFGYGAPGLSCKAGAVELLEFAAWSSRKAPKALLLGDSITEGTGVTAIGNSWAYLVSEAGNALASPRGGDGADAIAKRALYEIQQFASVRYAVFLAGTNDTDMTTWQRAIDNVAELCQTYGVTPVFCTLPPEAGDTNPVLVQNPYIRSSGHRYIDFARALTVGGNGTTRDEAKFFDSLHPNDAGHAAMYARVRLDLPELFD